MSRVLNTSPRSWRALTILCAASLALTSCGVASVPVHLTSGIPSRSIAVPLRVVGCTSTDACVAVGTAGPDAGQYPVGEDRLPTGGWRSISTPNEPSSMASSSSCWSNECLIGGSQLSGDLLWRYDALQQSIVPVAAPAGAQGISDLSCFADLSCAATDSMGVIANSRLTLTTNGGASWSAPRPMTWSAGKSVTSLVCSDASNCLVAATAYHVAALLEVTHNAGLTWSALPTPASWNSLTSLQCQLRHCEGLASTPLGEQLVRTQTFGQVWTSLKLTTTTNALACSTLSHCVLVGQTGTNAPWLAKLVNHTVKRTTLQYVPSPLTDVSCGTTICAAIGVSTLVALRS